VWRAKRDQIALAYDAALADQPVQILTWDKKCTHARHKYVFVTEDREAWEAHLKGAGIPTRVHYDTPLQREPVFAKYAQNHLPCPVADQLSQTALSLPKVIFVDQAATIGGSWKCPEVVGHFGVEVGVHLIENRPHTNAVFEALLEPSQRVAGNPDFGLMGKRRIPMRYARVLLYGGIAGRNLLKGKIERVRHSLKNMGEALRYRNLPFIYPKAGMAQVLNDLEARLKAHGAEFHFNRKIERLDVSQSGVTAFTSTGALSADHLVMSSRAHAPLAGLEHLWSERNDLSITSVVIKTEGPAPPNQSRKLP